MKLTFLSAFIFSVSTMVIAPFKATLSCTPEDMIVCVNSLVLREKKDIIPISLGFTGYSEISSKTLSCSDLNSMFTEERSRDACADQGCIIKSCT